MDVQLSPLVVVTGHPRSGTSMMMKMLHDGGMDIVADENSLKSLKHNKYGTFEILNYNWIIDNYQKVSGSAVKIVTQYMHIVEALVLETPLLLKMIFMTRPIRAIELSLKEMGVTWDPPPAESIALGNKVVEYHKIPTIYVDYNESLKYPVATCQRVIDFVGDDLRGKKLDIEKMISAIEPGECHHE